MLLVKNILVSESILEEEFVCNLQKCRGACCWEGDYGAPLESEEQQHLTRALPDIAGFLLPDSLKHIEEHGAVQPYSKPGFTGTTLMPDGACVFMTYDDNGIAQCGIELANRAGKTQMQKPISCHLYPVRVRKNPVIDFEALNYDRWDICSAACSLGRQLKVPLYVFVKDAIVRRYGQDFWNELDEVAKDLKAENSPNQT